MADYKPAKLRSYEPQASDLMQTKFLLLAQYGGKAVVPVADVCRDYFPHMTPEKFVRKVNEGQLAIPMVRIEPSQKAAKGIHIEDLAIYIDERRAAAVKEFKSLHSPWIPRTYDAVDD